MECPAIRHKQKRSGERYSSSGRENQKDDDDAAVQGGSQASSGDSVCEPVVNEASENVSLTETASDVSSDSRISAQTMMNTGMSDSDRRTLHSLKLSLSEQERRFTNEQEIIEEKKASTKEMIKEMFSNLRDVLLQKENDLVQKVDDEYSVAFGFLADFVRSIYSEKQTVNRVLETSGDVHENSIEGLKHDMEGSLNLRDDIFRQFRIPSLSLNEEAINTVKCLSFGEFRQSNAENSIHDTSQGETSEHDVQTVGEITCAQYSDDDNSEEHIGAVGYQEPLINENNLSILNVNRIPSVTDEHVMPTAPLRVVMPTDSSRNVMPTEPPTVVTATATSRVVMPTAPPTVIMATASSRVDDAPPPYWQAIGLEHPSEQGQPEIPGYYDIRHGPNILPDNKLELWHSFPIRREADNDRRVPMPVALTWNCGRICLADRANMRVKFFAPDGHVLASMNFIGTELHDLAFLEQANGEARYLLACQTYRENKKYILIGINKEDNAYVVRNVIVPYFYSAICRGPREQTLVGAKFDPKASYPAEVHLFTFNMGVLFTITHTPTCVKLAYPKAVEVFERNIIVTDWKLNSVSVFNEDSSPVGEYRGTPSFPLIKPLDLATDPKGNIMILNGEFSNIHVIDLHCNFIEVIEIPQNRFSVTASIRVIGFDMESKRLAVARSTGDVVVFSFVNGYDCLPQRNLPPMQGAYPGVQGAFPGQQLDRVRAPAVLPLIEGMLPSTIEGIINRPSLRNRSRQFHL